MAKKPQYYVPGKNRHRRKHYWWRYLLVFLLGQALVLPEFVLTVGTAATSMEVGTILEIAQVEPGDYLGEAYLNDTPLTFVMKLVSDPKKFTTFGGLAEISPALNKVYDDYIGKYTSEYGVDLDKDEFYELTFDQFPNYLKNKVMDLKLAEVLGKVGLNLDGIPVLPQLLYKTEGEEDVARSLQEVINLFSGDIMDVLGDIKISDIAQGVDLPGNLEDLKIGDLMGGDIMSVLGDLKISDLAEGADLPEAFADLKIGDLMGGDIMSVFNDMKLSDLGITGDSGIMAILGDKTIGDLTEGDFLSTITIGDALEIDDSATGIMAALKDCTLTADSITDKLNTLKLGDIFEDIAEDSMLYAFKDKEIMKLGDAFEDTYLYQVLNTRTYVEDGYANPTGPNGEEILTEEDTNKKYYIAADTPAIMKLLCEKKVDGDYLKLSEMSTKLNDVIQTATIADILGPQPEGSLIALFSDCTMNDIESRIQELKIREIMGDDAVADNPFLNAIADFYLMNKPADAPAGSKTISEGIKTLKLSDIMTITPGENAVLDLIADKYLYEDEASGITADQTIMGTIKTLTIGEAMAIDVNDQNTNPLLKAIAPVSVMGGDIMAAVKTCTVGEILGIDNTNSDPFLAAVADAKLTEQGIKEALNGLTLMSIVGENEMLNQEKLYAGYIDDEADFLYLADLYGKIYSDSECTIEVPAYENPGDCYVIEETLAGVWSLMFNSVEEAKTASVNGMGDLMKNVSNNITTTCLYDLADAGILTNVTGLDNYLTIDVAGQVVLLNPDKGNGGDKFTSISVADQSDFNLKKFAYGQLYTDGLTGGTYARINEYVAGKTYYKLDAKKLGEYTLSELVSVLGSLGNL